MDAIRLNNYQDASKTANEAMNILFAKLDEAIDDVESGRVLTEGEVWAEIDAI